MPARCLVGGDDLANEVEARGGHDVNCRLVVMFRRVLVALTALIAATAVPVFAQAPSSSPLEVAVGVHGVRRDSVTHAGGGLAGGYHVGRMSAAIELDGTRRAGHNDWRATMGPRLALVAGDRVRVFVHGLVGAAIRSGTTGLGWTAGVGADLRGSGRIGVRVQLDAVGERRDAVSATGGRASIWLVAR
jgi:hypothetical protein